MTAPTYAITEEQIAINRKELLDFFKFAGFSVEIGKQSDGSEDIIVSGFDNTGDVYCFGTHPLPATAAPSGDISDIELVEGRLEGLKILLDTPADKKTMADAELKYAIREVEIIRDCMKITAAPAPGHCGHECVCRGHVAGTSEIVCLRKDCAYDTRLHPQQPDALAELESTVIEELLAIEGYVNGIRSGDESPKRMGELISSSIGVIRDEIRQRERRAAIRKGRE